MTEQKAPDFALPWTTGTHPDNELWSRVHDARGRTVLPRVPTDLAALIVSAVNAYEPMREAVRRAHDMLIEINPSNYNDDDVCELNNASVEAIFTLADVLGENHGKSKQWWDDRRAALAIALPATEEGK